MTRISDGCFYDTARIAELVTGPKPGADVRYSIATLVNDRAQYNDMLASFQARGFGNYDCEFLMIDNTGTAQTCAYRGLNAALDTARGAFVILCHQDVRLSDDGRSALDSRLGELEARDPSWALAGNAGGVGPGRLAVRISDPHERDQKVGSFPAGVQSLDENFIVVKRASRVGFSKDLSGFHFYGADICLNAKVMGWRAYVIDFHLMHLSSGKKGMTFSQMEDAFRAKWAGVLAPMWLQTTCSLLWLGGGLISGPAGRMLERPYSKLARLLPGSRGFQGSLVSDFIGGISAFVRRFVSGGRSGSTGPTDIGVR